MFIYLKRSLLCWTLIQCKAIVHALQKIQSKKCFDASLFRTRQHHTLMNKFLKISLSFAACLLYSLKNDNNANATNFAKMILVVIHTFSYVDFVKRREMLKVPLNRHAKIRVFMFLWQSSLVFILFHAFFFYVFPYTAKLRLNKPQGTSEMNKKCSARKH